MHFKVQMSINKILNRRVWNCFFFNKLLYSASASRRPTLRLFDQSKNIFFISLAMKYHPSTIQRPRWLREKKFLKMENKFVFLMVSLDIGAEFAFLRRLLTIQRRPNYSPRQLIARALRIVKLTAGSPSMFFFCSTFISLSSLPQCAAPVLNSNGWPKNPSTKSKAHYILYICYSFKTLSGFGSNVNATEIPRPEYQDPIKEKSETLLRVPFALCTISNEWFDRNESKLDFKNA